MQRQSKRIAKTFILHRYIPEAKVYELSIIWKTEQPTPPALFNLAEIFIHPYKTIPNSQSIQNHRKLKHEQHNHDDQQPQMQDSKEKLLFQMEKQYKNQRETPIKQLKKIKYDLLNYDQLINRRQMMNLTIERNRQVITNSSYKHISSHKITDQYI